MLSLITGDDRPFVLSTPRLESDDRLHVRRSFNDPAVDGLFRLKSAPRPLDEIKELVGVNGKGHEALESY